MAVKKKKKAKRKIAKSESANTPFKAMMRIFKATKMVDCWRRLSEETKKGFKENPIIPFRIRAEENSGISGSVIRAFKKDIHQIIASSYVTLKKYNTKLESLDLNTAGTTMLVKIEKYIDEDNEDFDRWHLLYMMLKRLVFKDEENPLIEAGRSMGDLCFICNNIDRAYYYFEGDMHEPTELDPYIYQTYTLRKSPARKKVIKIDNKVRPVFWIGISEKGYVNWASLSSDLLCKDSAEKYEYPVYIQSHAIVRLLDRLAPLSKASIQVLLFDSIDKPVIVKGPGGLNFIEMRFNGAKVGYLLYDIIDKTVVIKTFMFITQNSTFEGNKLSKKYNLTKYSKKYFELDRLKTFIYTDVYKDKELKKIFTECGCEDLFSVWEEDDDISFNDNYARNLKKIFFPRKQEDGVLSKRAWI